MKLSVKYRLLAFLFFITAFMPAAAYNSPRRSRLPFAVGEKLTFSVRWGVIRAGVATLEVRENFKLAGRDTFRIVHTARSARFFDPFYRVRNRIESYIDARELYSVRYERTIREGGYSKDGLIIYDQEYGRAYEDGHMFEITEGVQDVISSFYFLRTMELEDGKIYEFDVGSDKTVWPLEVEVIGRERITVPAGTFNTILVQPRILEGEGIFKHEGDIFLWLTDDERRIPVMGRSEIIVGAVTILLTDKKLPRLR